MSKFMEDEVKKELEGHFTKLDDKVRLVYFTQKNACGTCADQRELLEEVAGLSGKVELEVFDLVEDSDEAKRLGIDKIPATAIMSSEDRGIRFFGLTAGYEFASLIEAITMVSIGDAGLEPGVVSLAAELDQPLHLEIMVTLPFPYCPKMVRLAHQLAFVNDKVRADMVESSEFPTLVQRYNVHGVPRTVINGVPAFEGALPAEKAILEILKHVDPDKYEALDAAVREARGERQVAEVDPDKEYDILIVGAGPAAMSAAIYAVRKNHNVAMLGSRAGGQINDTASVENYLGLPQVGGSELAELFRKHVESYPVAHKMGADVQRITSAAGKFETVTAGGKTYLSRCVIFAAGAEYRRLGVPGEERFIGKGIAFCATCDAPLFAGKQVAVVGGGNSAFTAIRDLAAYASDIQLLHILEDFQADDVLVKEVRELPNVTLHTGVEVKEFLGSDRLTGVRVAPAAGSNQEGRFDLKVDGVFLEIGLVPNTGAVSDLVELNEAGEVPVGRDGSTRVPGLFAAGDASDERDKQIIVAAGAGARAALAADRYLNEAG